MSRAKAQLEAGWAWHLQRRWCGRTEARSGPPTVRAAAPASSSICRSRFTAPMTKPRWLNRKRKYPALDLEEPAAFKVDFPVFCAYHHKYAGSLLLSPLLHASRAEVT